MDIVAAEETVASSIPVDHRVAAHRYIAAIVEREGARRLDGPFGDLQSLLWHRFVTDYAAVTSGPFARHGSDAIRAALGRL
jgi:hypothetical protein